MVSRKGSARGASALPAKPPGRGTERQRIEILRTIFSGAGERNNSAKRDGAAPALRVDGPRPGLIVGIGDDAAVLLAPNEPLVWTVDAAVEGTHFRRKWLSFEEIGYRSTMAAVSDLAAMGAAPLGVLSALSLPDDVDDEALSAIARGQREAATAVRTAVIGGNLAAGRELSITTTALGHAVSPLLRSGAKVGDSLWLIGCVGRAAAGLRFLMGSDAASPNATSAEGAAPFSPTDEDLAAKALCIRAWRKPFALVSEGFSLRGVASAAIDVSDGLVCDVNHLAEASGVVAVIEVATLRDVELERAAALLSVTALELALFGGEDYALAVAAPADAALHGGVRIGWFEEPSASDAEPPRGEEAAPAEGALRGAARRDVAPTLRGAPSGAATNVVGVWPDNTRKPLPPRGFDHFGEEDPPD